MKRAVTLSLPPNADVSAGLQVKSGQRNLCTDSRCTTDWTGSPGWVTASGWDKYATGGGVANPARVVGGYDGDPYSYTLGNTGAGVPSSDYVFFKQTRYGVAQAGDPIYWSAYFKNWDPSAIYRIAAFGAYSSSPTVLDTDDPNWKRVYFTGIAQAGQVGCGVYVAPGKSVRISRVMYGIGSVLPDYVDGAIGGGSYDATHPPTFVSIESYNDPSGTLTPGDHWWLAVDTRDIAGNYSLIEDWHEIEIGVGHNAARINCYPDPSGKPSWNGPFRIWGVQGDGTGLDVPPPGVTAKYRTSFDWTLAYFRAPGEYSSTTVPTVATSVASALHTSTLPSEPVYIYSNGVELKHAWWIGITYRDADIVNASRTLFELYTSSSDRLTAQITDEAIGIVVKDGTNSASIGCRFPSNPGGASSWNITMGTADKMYPGNPAWLSQTEFDRMYLNGPNDGTWYMYYTNDGMKWDPNTSTWVQRTSGGVPIHDQQLNWGQSQVMSALLWAYETWKDTKYLDWFVEAADFILTSRDDVRGVKMCTNDDYIVGHYDTDVYGTSHKTWRIADYQTAVWVYGYNSLGNIVMSLKLVNGQPDNRTVQIVNKGTTFDIITQNPDGVAVTFADLTVDSTSDDYYVKRINNSKPPGGGETDPTEWNSSGNGFVAYDPLSGAGIPASDTPVNRAAAKSSIYQYHVDQVITGPCGSFARFAFIVKRDALTSYYSSATAYNAAARDHLAYESDEYNSAGDTGWYIMRKSGGRAFADGVDAGMARQAGHASMHLWIGNGYGTPTPVRALHLSRGVAILNYLVDHMYSDDRTDALRWYYADGPYAAGWGYGGTRLNNNEGTPGDPDSRPYSCNTFWWFGNSTGYIQWDDFNGHADAMISDLVLAYRAESPHASRLTWDVLRRITVGLLSTTFRKNPTSGKEEGYYNMSFSPYDTPSEWETHRACLGAGASLFEHSTDVLSPAASGLYEMIVDGGHTVTALEHFAIGCYAYKYCSKVPVECLEIAVQDSAGRTSSRSVIYGELDPDSWGKLTLCGAHEMGSEPVGRIEYFILQQNAAASTQGPLYRADPAAYFANPISLALSIGWFPFLTDVSGYWGYTDDEGLPTFTREGWFLKIGDSSPIFISETTQFDSFLRSDYGAADLSLTHFPEYSPLLGLPPIFDEDTPIELWDESFRLWDGFIIPYEVDVVDESVNILAEGPIARLQHDDTYTMIWTIHDYDLWSTTQNDDEAERTTQYEVDLDGHILFVLPADTRVRGGSQARAYFILPTWEDYGVQRITATWASSNPDTTGGVHGPWAMELLRRNYPNGSTLSTPWNQDPIHESDSGSIDETFADSAVLIFRIKCTKSSSTAVETLTDRKFKLTNVCLYVRHAYKVKIDEAIKDVIVDSGLIEAANVSTPVGGIGSVLDQVAVLTPTTRADAIATLSDLHDKPLRVVLEGNTALIEERPTTPPPGRHFIAMLDPIAEDQCACPEMDVQLRGEEHVDYVVCEYSCRDNAHYIDGTLLHAQWPAGTIGPFDRVLTVTYPEDRYVTSTKAQDYCKHTYAYLRMGEATGTIPLEDTAIRNTEGQVIPAWHLREGDWISVPDDLKTLDYQPFYITGIEVTADKVVVHIGESELEYHTKQRRWRQHEPRPKPPRALIKKLKGKTFSVFKHARKKK